MPALRRPGLLPSPHGLPARCEVCHAWPAQPVCGACLAAFAPARPRCSRCAVLLPAGQDLCGHCLREPPPLDACHAAVTYGYPWAGLVGRFKFAREPGWAACFAGLLATPAVQAEVARARWVLPMPLSARRLAERGYNQAHELARRLAPAKADARLVLRLRDTPPQAGLDQAARRANLRGAFAPEPLRAGELRGAALLLVDDVMTTGASLHALAAALRDAGAARVAAVVFARTEGPGVG